MDLHGHHVCWVTVLEDLAAVFTAVGLFNVLNNLLLALLTSQVEVLVIWLDIRDETAEFEELVLVAGVGTKLHALIVLLNPSRKFFNQSMISRTFTLSILMILLLIRKAD